MMQRKNMLRSAWPLGAALILLSLAACGFQPPAASLVGGNAAGRAAQPDGQLSGYPYDVIQVVGFGQATGTPDLATLSLGCRSLPTRWRRPEAPRRRRCRALWLP